MKMVPGPTGDSPRVKSGLASRQELTLLRRAAEQGNVEAQWQLGLLYASGEGLDLNFVEAASWIERAAEQGFVRAQSVLAWLYANGLGVEHDDGKAGYWYRRAAEQGSAKDQYMVATMYRFGRYGVGRDPAAMIQWYQLAAQQGFAPAQLALGLLLVQGKELLPDYETAFQWLSLAHVNGSRRAGEAIHELLGRMSTEQVERAKTAMLRPRQLA
jgi:TPR repeat protein